MADRFELVIDTNGFLIGVLPPNTAVVGSTLGSRLRLTATGARPELVSAAAKEGITFVAHAEAVAAVVAADSAWIPLGSFGNLGPS